MQLRPFYLSTVAVLGVSIAVPLALQPGQDFVLSCTVSAAGGGLQIRSAAAAAPHLGQLHLTAHSGQSLFEEYAQHAVLGDTSASPLDLRYTRWQCHSGSQPCSASLALHLRCPL